MKRFNETFRIVFLVLILPFLIVVCGPTRILGETPSIVELDSEVTQYDRFKINGFEVYVHWDIAKLGEARHAGILRELEGKLKETTALIPKDKLTILQKTLIWIDWGFSTTSQFDIPTTQAMAFYRPPDARREALEPAKRGGVAVSAMICLDGSSAKSTTRWYQNWLLHELAHSYHYSVLGPNHLKVIDTFRAAKDGRLHILSYASKDCDEYFAELSVAYLGRKREYPRTRLELKEHDPRGYRLMREVWGEISDDRLGIQLPIFRSRCCVK